MIESDEELAVRDAWGALRLEFVDSVIAALAQEDPKSVRVLTKSLRSADMADILEILEQPQRERLIASHGTQFDVEALAELDLAVRDEIIASMPPDIIASAIKKLDTDDALYLIEDLDAKEQAEILAKVSTKDRAALNRALLYPEETAGRLMQTEFVAVADFWTAGKAVDHIRQARGLPDDFVEVYVTDPGFHLKGTVPVSRLVRAKRERPIESLMDDEQTVFSVNDGEDEVAFKFEKYNLVSAAVVDTSGRLVGMLMVDDILEIIQQRADLDIKHMGGVAAEDAISGNVWATTRARFAWLGVNLLTAILASWVISWFDATIEQMVALAVLMPIVASMGGNAGTQTMTVAVRALATRQLGPVNALKVTMRECAVGLVNGLLFAVIVGCFAWWWFGSDHLGLVIAAAMVINLLAAALAGILVPLALDYFDIDPAIASGVFVTTVTDVVGFFAFLGLAAVWLV
jgi:magnesium transporter